MNNTTLSSTNSTKAEVFSPTFRLAASISYLMLLILSLMINLFQLAVYVKGRKLFKSMAFFIIAWQMLINDLIMLIVMIIFMTTVIISDQPILSDTVYTVLSFAESFTYNGLLLFAFLLTLNRLAVFATPKIGKFFFDFPRIYGSVILFWILTAGLVTGIMLSPCPIVARPAGLGFGSGCINGEANIFNYIGQYVATYLPIVMIVAYILIYLEIKVGIFCNMNCCKLRKVNSMHSKAEIKLLFQAALICSTFFIQNFCWTYLPFMTSGFSFGDELIFFAIMLSSILLYSVDAIVVLIFNSMARRVAISFFKSETNLAFTTQYRPSIVTSSTSQAKKISVSPMVQ
uniref:G-protein coupled receptors family 1 profile domain-containing protein n=1 Tax=Acrobeloides nanus TaxID=290746 RepID=A0A914D4F2_9BILA